MAAPAGPAAARFVSIPMCCCPVDGEGPPRPPPSPDREGEGSGRGDNEHDDFRLEKQLTRLVRFVVLVEWVGNAFGALALAWATTVLLGGFCSSLNRQDFWFGSIMIFVESIRVSSRIYKFDSQYLFGSARALKWISSSFPLTLLRPQEGNKLVLIMGLWFYLVRNTDVVSSIPVDLALFILWSRQPQLPQQWLIISLLQIAYLIFAAKQFILLPIVLILAPPHQENSSPHQENSSPHQEIRSLVLSQWMEMLPVILVAAIALPLLRFRPRIVAKLTSTLCGRRLIFLAKVISALWSAVDLLLAITAPIPVGFEGICRAMITMLALLLGSQQKPAATDSMIVSCCTDAFLHIFFLLNCVQPIALLVSIFQIFVPRLPIPAVNFLSLVLLLVLLVIGNLQIPAAVAQIVLSSLRLRKLLRHQHIDYSQQVRDDNPNLVPAIAVFYVLALVQGSLYIIASFLSFFSSFPRRRLMRSKFGAASKLLGKKAINLYYQHVSVSRTEIGLFGEEGKITSFTDFAIESLSSSSSSRDMQVAGLYFLHYILLSPKDHGSTQDLILRVTCGSGIAVPSTLIGMLAWAPDVEKDGCDIRLLAAEGTAELASSLRISSIPGMLKKVSSVLKLAENTNTDPAVVPDEQGQDHQQTPLASANGVGGSVQQLTQGSRNNSNGGWRSWIVCGFLQRRTKEPNEQGQGGHQQTPLASANGVGGSVQQLTQGSRNNSNGGWRSWIVCGFLQRRKEEPALSLTRQVSSLALKGMQILEKLAGDLDNCAEILKDDMTNLISKTIGIIGYASTSDNNEQNDELVCSSLEFLRRLATTGERIGAELRQELWNHPFLLTCLARVLEDNRNGSGSSSPHKLWEPAMDIIAKLALNKDAALEIGKIQVITARLLHAFLGRQGSTNMYYDQPLRKVSGEALANLALWGTANCLAILDEPGYQVIHDLTNMLSEDHRYVAASLLLNICENCSVNLLLSHPHASEHLSSALTTVMGRMKAAEGKQLESLINLASEIGNVISDAFVRELESQNKCGAELVQDQLLRTLNSKKIPNPEYPRMRRVIVKILISILESCPRTVEKLMEEGMVERLMESLTKILKSPSKVEEYRVFYGNIGVVLEDREPMSTLVTRAKALLVQRTTRTA